LEEKAMAKLTRKLWVGIGVASLAGAASMPRDAAAQDIGHKAHGAPAGAQEGANPESSTPSPKAGEGGEAYLTDGGPKDTRIRFYRDIELVRGHLLVGQELIDMDLWDEALPHFLHPSEELYGLMEKYIKLHSMQPFGRELQALAQTVKAKRKGAYERALKAVHQRLDGALKVAKGFMRPERKFAVQSAIEVLRTAQAEYEGAMENGAFTKPVEYQDSRGFVWRAERVIEAASGSGPQALDATSLAKVRTAFARLKAAWPTPLPPAKPLLDGGLVSSLISEIELYTSPMTR
jgi:hypothetical protein